jgi:hypothetical protein
MSNQKSGKTVKSTEISAADREMWRPGRRTLVDIPPAIQAELDAKGFSCRWLNAKEFFKGGNVHKSGWRPYLPEKGSSTGTDVNLGRSPEGYLQRGDLLLGYMPTWAFNEHSAEVKERTRRQSGANKRQAAELRENLRRAGVDGSVDEGYDDE